MRRKRFSEWEVSKMMSDVFDKEDIIKKCFSINKRQLINKEPEVYFLIKNLRFIF